VHDKPAKVLWERGTKKHKRGSTAAKAPTKEDDIKADLIIDEQIQLGVTLYAVNPSSVIPKFPISLNVRRVAKQKRLGHMDRKT